MPRVDLPTGLEGSEDFPRSRKSLTNCFNNLEGQVLSRPGVLEITTTDGVARGQFVWNGSLYQVVSQELLKITNVLTGATTVIGTIAGSQVVTTAIGFNTATILVNGGAIYTLDKSDALAQISGNANFVPCQAIAHIDGRFVYIPSDGSPAFFSDVGSAGSVQPLSFFDAEALPDKNQTVFDFNGTLYIGGTDSIELFRNTGASPNPFQRITGARISNGFIGGLLEYNETFLFIGREKDQDFGIYALGQGQAVKISNQVIDLILSQSTQDQLQEVVASRFKWRGFDIATFTIAQISFGFLNGAWFFLESVNEFDIGGRWGGGFVTQFKGTYFTAFEDKIGKLDKVNTDYGNPVIKTIDMGFQDADNDWFTAQSIEIDVTQGFSASDGSVGLFMSNNNEEYSDGFYRDLGALGEYSAHLEWNPPGGLGMYNGFMGMRLQTPSDVSFASSMAASFR